MISDEQKIRRLLAQWAQLYDDNDAAGWTMLFAENGRFAVDAPARNHVGRAAIRDYIDTQIANAPAGRRTKHMCANAAIRFSGESAANADVDFVVYARRGDEPWSIISVGRYLNKLVRQNGEWLFLENLVTHP